MPYENINYIPIIVAIAVAAVLAALSLWKKLLTPAAIAVATIMLVLASLFAEYTGIVVYGVAFVLSGAIAVIGKEKRAEREEGLHKRHGTRGVVQVLCNGGPALVFAAAWFATGRISLLTAFVATLAAGFADSAASDIGILSRTRARNIITMKVVPSGISGGITVLGSVAALLASFSVAAAVLPLAGYGVIGFLIAGAFGFLGTVIDSVLGATVQVKYRCEACGTLTERTEHCGQPTVRVSGIKFMDNDLVNLLSVIIVGIIVAVLPI